MTAIQGPRFGKIQVWNASRQEAPEMFVHLTGKDAKLSPVDKLVSGPLGDVFFTLRVSEGRFEIQDGSPAQEATAENWRPASREDVQPLLSAMRRGSDHGNWRKLMEWSRDLVNTGPVVTLLRETFPNVEFLNFESDAFFTGFPEVLANMREEAFMQPREMPET